MMRIQDKILSQVNPLLGLAKLPNVVTESRIQTSYNFQTSSHATGTVSSAPAGGTHNTPHSL